MKPPVLEGHAREPIPHQEIWAILHKTCHARETMPDDFPFHWPDCREYRFMGALGFGGKVWAYDERWYVNYYPEDKRADRDEMAAQANEQLATLKAARAKRKKEILA